MNHFQMIDAVNNATTEYEHREAQHRLDGWRVAADYFGHGWSGIEADLHTMDVHGESTLMCCGVLLDWKPA